MMYIAYAACWIATAISIIVAMLITRSAVPLWALFIPAMITFRSKDEEDN